MEKDEIFLFPLKTMPKTHTIPICSHVLSVWKRTRVKQSKCQTRTKCARLERKSALSFPMALSYYDLLFFLWCFLAYFFCVEANGRVAEIYTSLDCVWRMRCSLRIMGREIVVVESLSFNFKNSKTRKKFFTVEVILILSLRSKAIKLRLTFRMFEFS